MRLVLDTNVVVSAMLWGGRPRLLLDAARAGPVRLFTSATLLAELDETLRYPKFRGKIDASHLAIEQLVALYAGLATVVRPAPIEPVILADPDDDAVLACALAARAACIVSGDSHLLNLGAWRGIEVLSVQAALRRLDESSERC
ncbi:putative toxin-antitoxin system toxin component, PIN family [uncultured Thiodictyon sp.]|jgi:putative PIN family toxin of toxin-antitoxin system|uniref:putative toxin-antitoxin system toxin component, PIN family n=1 Tax=uncultured Thiodictyon sp. TaxID=1846217 RepID=UPI0025E66003|nr:putative toxin-antitoxin system toxin component, PIN family [uncultured Thiodictyon sp.]